MFLLKVTEHCVTVAAPHFFFPWFGLFSFSPLWWYIVGSKIPVPPLSLNHIDLKHKYGEVHNSSTKMMIMVTGSTYCSHL